MDRISEVAKILQKDVKRVWEPIENYDITLETVRKIIPPTLAMFLNDLAFLSDESTRQSIAHDLIALIVRQVPPKHITLASSVKHITGSKDVVDQLSKLGHCCSNTELQRIFTSNAQSELKAAEDQGVIIPPNILPGSFGLIQAAADNDDFQESTRDGKNTTQGTTMILFQQQAPGDRQRYVRRVEKTRKTSLNPDDYNQLMKQKHIIFAKMIKPLSYRGTEGIRKLSEDYSSHTLSIDAAVTMDHQWLLSRLAPTKLFDIDIQPGTQQCPNWSSFNSAHCTTKLDTSVIGYCPMLNYPSTDPSTIYTVMSNLQKMMCTLNQKHAIITFDLALYKIAKEIQRSRPIEFGNVIIRDRKSVV